MTDICPIKNSSEIPESKVYNKEGKELALKSYIGDKPTVLVFYRGGWCGYCSKHLSALEEAYPEMKKSGFELLAISPDDYTMADSSKIDSGLPTFEILSDKNANAINDFGISWQVDDQTFEKYLNKYNLDLEKWSGSDHHLLPVPAVFIVKEGKIEYQHVDPEYANRLSPDLILTLISSLDE